MTMIEETDKPMLEKLADEALSVRSREAITGMLEHAYVLGRRAENTEAQRLVMARISLSESNER